MIKAVVIWVVLRLGVVYGTFYLVGWFATLNANILEWEMFEDSFHRGLFAIVFLLATGLIIFMGYDDRNEIQNKSKL